jgi:hypothetical protein
LLLELLVCRPQPVTDPGLRQYVLRMLRVGFDLLSELPYIDPQVLRIGLFMIPQLAKQELMGQDFTCVLHQQAQEIVFLGRQFHLLVADPDDASHQVDREVTGAEDRTLPVHRSW